MSRLFSISASESLVAQCPAEVTDLPLELVSVSKN